MTARFGDTPGAIPELRHRDIYHPAMDTQSGARSGLVDPFGRELEEWLRDAPATHSPYVADLVVPPVTGPINWAEAQSEAQVQPVPETAAPAADVSPDASGAHDRGRHASAATTQIPDIPTRCSLTFVDLAAAVSASTGRPSLDRIELFEEQLRVQEADRARLAAWEAALVGHNPAEASAARAYVHEIFRELFSDAAPRTLRRRTAMGTGDSATVGGTVDLVEPISAVFDPSDLDMSDLDSADSGAASDTVLVHTGPAPLVLPATGPNAIDQQAFEAAVRAHSGHTGEVQIDAAAILQPVEAHEEKAAAPAITPTVMPDSRRSSWWQRLVAGLLRTLRRR
jgi:hypothetical protein